MHLGFVALITLLAFCGMNQLGYCQDRLYRVYRAGKCGYINRTGKIRIPPSFDDCSDFSEGLAAILVGGRFGEMTRGAKVGYIDNLGRIVIRPQFDSPQGQSSFSEGLALINLGFNIDTDQLGKQGYIDAAGRIVISPRFRNAKSFSEGLALVDGVFIDAQGRVVLRPASEGYYFDGSFIEGLARVIDRTTANVGENGIGGFIDKSGSRVISKVAVAIEDFSEGMASFVYHTNSGNRCGFLNKDGQEVIRPFFERCGKFAEGLAAVFSNGRMGFINKTGKFVIKPQFQSCYSSYTSVFSGGLACVKFGKFEGFVDKSGKVVIPAKFEVAFPFQGNLARVLVSDPRRSATRPKVGYIDKTGRFVWVPTN